MSVFYDLTLFYSYFSCTAQIHKLKFISEYYSFFPIVTFPSLFSPVEILPNFRC